MKRCLWSWKKALVLGGSLFLLLLFGGRLLIQKWNNGGAASTVRAANAAVDVTDLYREYEMDEAAANRKYKGKELLISGAVRYVDRDVAGTLFLTLRGNDLFSSVQCYFNDESASKLASLRPGDIVEVRGRCTGLVINVLLKECTITKVVKNERVVL